MSSNAEGPLGEDAAEGRSMAIRQLLDMLDYAMIGGAELRLPKFVFLLRVASEELTNSLEEAAKGDGVAQQDVAVAPAGAAADDP